MTDKKSWTGWVYCNECDETKKSPCFRTVNLKVICDEQNPSERDICNRAKTLIDRNPKFCSCLVIPDKPDAVWHYVKFNQIIKMFKDTKRTYDFDRINDCPNEVKRTKPKGRFADIELI